MPDHPSSSTNDHDRVVSIRTGRRHPPAAGIVKTPAPSGDLGQRDLGQHGLDQHDLDRYERSGEADDYRHRTAVNAIVFLFVVGLVIAGIWLADTITTMRKNQDCVLSGKRGCSPIEAPAPAR